MSYLVTKVCRIRSRDPLLKSLKWIERKVIQVSFWPDQSVFNENNFYEL